MQYCAVSALPRTAAPVAWPPGVERPRHAREWLLALVLVLGAHALLLQGLPELEPGAGARAPGEAPAAVLVVRTLEPEAREAPPGQAPRAAEPAGPLPTAQTPQTPQTPQARPPGPASSRDQAPPAGAAAPRQAMPMPGPTDAPPPGRDAAQAPLGAQLEAAMQGADAVEAAADREAAQVYAGAPPPVWATRLPGDFVAHYQVQRGEEPARTLTLRLETGEARYALHLEPAGGGRGPEQSSHGRLEATGLAPERYLDRRRARAAAAANFDRDRLRISYSGARLEQPLFAGAQDRLSWIVQLAAVIDADPARWQERARLPLYVSGARGDAQLWVFAVRGRVAVEGPGGAVQELLHVVREPERPYDVRVEAWLDPARQHLPARLQLSPVPVGQPVRWTRQP